MLITIAVLAVATGCSGSSTKSQPTTTARPTMTEALVTRLVGNVLARLRPALDATRSSCGVPIVVRTPAAAAACRKDLANLSTLSRRLVVVQANLREPQTMQALVAGTSDAAGAVVTVVRDYPKLDCLPTPVAAGARRIRCTSAARDLATVITALTNEVQQWPSH